MVIISSVLLNIENTSTLHLNNSFWWMLGCTFILALETVLYKYAFLSVDWITGVAWPVILSFFLILPILLVPSVRRDIFRNKKTFSKHLPIFVAEELCTFTGIGAGTYAISVAPVTIVETIGEIQVIFVLLYAKFFKGLFPSLFKEDVTTASLKKKLVLFFTIIIGVLLALM
jgi:drug/metabolite transporter (DMT)-like permease